MNVLWPENLFASARELPALKLLEEQADALQSISDGRLRGEVTTSVVSGVVIATLSAVAVENDSHRFEILRVRSPAGSWRCVIENYHLDSPDAKLFEASLNLLRQSPRSFDTREQEKFCAFSGPSTAGQKRRFVGLSTFFRTNLRPMGAN